MTNEEQTKINIKKTEDLISKLKNKNTLTYLQALYNLKCNYEILNDDKCCDYADEIIDIIVHRKLIYEKNIKNNQIISDILVSSYDTKARHGDFKSFCIALEYNRPIEKQFFLPRMKLLEKHGVVQGIQDLIDDKLDLLVLNEPPRVGKSTVGLFLQVLLGGMYPDESILSAGHSMSLIQSFYNEILNIITSDEYRYNEIFPNNNIVNKSAEYLYIDLNKERRFHTYNYISIESGGTGKVQAERLLYCDDLIKNVEQANNPDVLDKLYHNYTSTIKDRKISRKCKDGLYRTCPEIHINTPWSLHDVTSRVVANAEEMDSSDRVRIISIPCYDENGESNFMYDYGKGFDKKYYDEMRIAEDPVIFSAKYLMQPIERDGLVFNKDNVTYYTELPGGKPDKVVAYMDVSHGGDDFFSMPICYVYGTEAYVVKVFFRNKFGGDDYSRPLVRNLIMEYKVTKCGVEKNNGGDFYGTLVSQDLRKKNYYCNITLHQAPTRQTKADRILACQNDIKGIASESNTYKIYFKTPDSIQGDKDYQDAMQNLFSWNQNLSKSTQKRQHDDFPDSLAGLIQNVLGGHKAKAKSVNGNDIL